MWECIVDIIQSNSLFMMCENVRRIQLNGRARPMNLGHQRWPDLLVDKFVTIEHDWWTIGSYLYVKTTESFVGG